MAQNINQYHFVTNWRVKATEEEVYRILDDVNEIKYWWSAVYLDVRTIEEGSGEGIGKVVELYTKVFLPYTLLWKFRTTEKRFPNHLALEAFGDFKGKGIWTIKQEADSDYCTIQYDWSIVAEKPILKYLSFFLKPIFSANHHWAIRKGQESFKLELLRRQATSDEERDQISESPQPVFPHNLLGNKVF
jgi:hypothetical protein